MRTIALLLPWMTACSLTMTAVPPGYQPRTGGPPPECSSSGGRITADWVGAVSSTLLALLAYKVSGACFAHETECDSEISAAVPFALLGVAYVASALRGGRVKSACEEAHETHQAMQRAPR